jgi:predicted DCC family thiol-disulfide oxidoreductase YuxK
MPSLDSLSPDLCTALTGRDVIVFDGECALCSGFFRFMVARDRQERFAFATAQSPLGQALYRELGLPTVDYETNLVITGGRIHQRIDAFVAAMISLGSIWRAAALLRLLPGPLRDFLYHRIARNRYAIFGRYDSCMVPDPALRARFLDGGIGP